MTDLLAPVLRRGAAGPEGARRPLALNAALAGLAAPVIALLLMWAVGLVAWFATDGGSHGTTQSVLRVAADAWLLAHGAHLDLGDGVVVTASPLGLTVLCGWLVHRLGRWAGSVSEVEDVRTAGLGAVVLGGSYGLLAMAVALLASTPSAAPGLKLAFLGSAVVAGASGGLGLLRGAGLLGVLRRTLPEPVLAVLHAALVVVVGMVAAGALLTAVAVAVRGAAVANVAEGLHLDVIGLGFSVLLALAIAPNVALLAGSYLVGPGFSVGTESVVSMQEVTLGAVPLVPVLGALPPQGWTPGWVLLLLAVPVTVGLAAGGQAMRLTPPPSLQPASLQTAALRGLAGGAVGAVALALLTSQAGGAVGPGRMAETGAGLLPVLGAALLSLAPSAACGAVAVAWRSRQLMASADEPATHQSTGAPTSGPSVPGQRVPRRRAAVRVPEQRDRSAETLVETADHTDDHSEHTAGDADDHTAGDAEDTVRVRLPRGTTPPEG